MNAATRLPMFASLQTCIIASFACADKNGSSIAPKTKPAPVLLKRFKLESPHSAEYHHHSKQFTMYKANAMLVLPAIVIFLSCGNNNSKNNTITTASDETANEVIQTTASQTSQDDGLAGEWELVGFVQDTNDNLQVDAEERKNLKAPSFKDYMKFNSNGTGLFTSAKMEGRYEVEEKAGKKQLRWIDKANGPHRIGTIIKISSEELHIKEPGGNGLFVWKRL